MRIYEKIVSFVRPNPKFGAKLAIVWQNEHFNQKFGPLMPSFYPKPLYETLKNFVGIAKNSEFVMPDLSRHPEFSEVTGFPDAFCGE
jgi:hypothetical protein